MEIQILKSFLEIEPFLSQVQQYADKNRKSLGFLPQTAYEEQASLGRLWVAINRETKDYMGHLLFGGRLPLLKVFQLIVHNRFRKVGIGTSLLNELINYANHKCS